MKKKQKANICFVFFFPFCWFLSFYCCFSWGVFMAKHLVAVLLGPQQNRSKTTGCVGDVGPPKPSKPQNNKTKHPSNGKGEVMWGPKTRTTKNAKRHTCTQRHIKQKRKPRQIIRLNPPKPIRMIDLAFL